MEQLKQDQEIQDPILAENQPPIVVLGWVVDFTNDISDPSVLINNRENKITVNFQKFDSIYSARNAGIFTVAKEIALSGVIQNTDTRKTLEMFTKNPDFTGSILQFAGAKVLGERETNLTSEIFNQWPLSNSSVREFKNACLFYLAIGSFPETTGAVREELEKLPVSRSGEHLLNALASDRVALSRKQNYFDKFISPAINRLKKVDVDLRAGAMDDFKPSTDSSQKMELNESEIMQLVEPFLGGYFREKVMDGVDWQNMKVVATGVPTEKLLPPEESRQISPENKVFIFKGKNGLELKNGNLTTPLPASALVWPETTSQGLTIRQSENGVYTLEWQGENGKEPPETYEFKFEKSENIIWQKIDPTDDEQGIPESVIETLSEETKTFLEELKNARITDEAKVRQIARRVQKGIEYVNDSNVGMALAMADQQYFTKLEELKKGDCDVCNFYALAQIRALGIPCRMITGFHISRDKRFDFAALAGTKHAWLEWWNKDVGKWQRIDATPPSQEEEKDEDNEKGGGGGGDGNIRVKDEEKPEIEPDESDDDPWQIFEKEDLAELKKKLEKITETDSVQQEKVRQSKIFEEIYGITKERWEEIRKLAEKIGQEKIPGDVAVSGSESTVSTEWEEIFKLMLIAYRMPDNEEPTMGRESLGGELVDPVLAGIDVLVGSDDPFGYRRAKKREKIEKLPIHFSNDFLLDTTASMKATNNQGKALLELERNFVISSLYEGLKINEKIKQRSAEFSEKPIVINHILSIHGGNEWREILKTAPVSMKELAKIDDLLKKSRPGGGAMADAIEHYLETLENDKETMVALKNGDMVKTLTIITDGNLWCSACGQESCNYEFHGPSLIRVQKALKKLRESGVFINTIGFTENSNSVVKLFATTEDPDGAVVVENLGGALKSHHRQILRAMAPIIKVGSKIRN